MTQSNTPGPWTIEDGEIVANGVVLGTVYGADDYPCCDEDIDEECYKNAALIAAAPDLKHACLAALGFLGGVSVLSKEQLQTTLADALKKAGVNKKWSSV
jgi:hypothetical protein